MSISTITRSTLIAALSHFQNMKNVNLLPPYILQCCESQKLSTGTSLQIDDLEDQLFFTENSASLRDINLLQSDILFSAISIMHFYHAIATRQIFSDVDCFNIRITNTFPSPEFALNKKLHDEALELSNTIFIDLCWSPALTECQKNLLHRTFLKNKPLHYDNDLFSTLPKTNASPVFGICR